MLAMNYRGPLGVRIDQKPIPEILHPQDAIVRITRSCICGSDLHLYNGSVSDTRVGTASSFRSISPVENAFSVSRSLMEIAMSRPRERLRWAVFSGIPSRRCGDQSIERPNVTAISRILSLSGAGDPNGNTIVKKSCSGRSSAR